MFNACHSIPDFGGEEFWVDATWTGSDYKMGSSSNLLDSLDTRVSDRIGKLSDFYTVRNVNGYECLKATYNAPATRFKLFPASCTDSLKYFCYQYNGVNVTLND
jgi:hypothetical protein